METVHGGGVSSPDTRGLSPVRATVDTVNEYDPEADGKLLTGAEVCRLLHVSRSHLPNLRANGTLRGYKLHTRGSWRYPSEQPTLQAALAALRGVQQA